MDKRNKKVLVAIDGSKNSKRAILEARRHIKMFDSEISLLTVIHPSFPGYHRFLEQDQRQEIEEEKLESHPDLDEALELLGKTDAEVSTQIKFGDPANQILETAEKGNYDLIIMGSRGRGRFSQTILGSTSNKVLNHAKMNVLIVK